MDVLATATATATATADPSLRFTCLGLFFEVNSISAVSYGHVSVQSDASEVALGEQTYLDLDRMDVEQPVQISIQGDSLGDHIIQWSLEQQLAGSQSRKLCVKDLFEKIVGKLYDTQPDLAVFLANMSDVAGTDVQGRQMWGSYHRLAKTVADTRVVSMAFHFTKISHTGSHDACYQLMRYTHIETASGIGFTAVHRCLLDVARQGNVFTFRVVNSENRIVVPLDKVEYFTKAGGWKSLNNESDSFKSHVKEDLELQIDYSDHPAAVAEAMPLLDENQDEFDLPRKEQYLKELNLAEAQSPSDAWYAVPSVLRQANLECAWVRLYSPLRSDAEVRELLERQDLALRERRMSVEWFCFSVSALNSAYVRNASLPDDNTVWSPGEVKLLGCEGGGAAPDAVGITGALAPVSAPELGLSFSPVHFLHLVDFINAAGVGQVNDFLGGSGFQYDHFKDLFPRCMPHKLSDAYCCYVFLWRLRSDRLRVFLQSAIGTELLRKLQEAEVPQQYVMGLVAMKQLRELMQSGHSDEIKGLAAKSYEARGGDKAYMQEWFDTKVEPTSEEKGKLVQLEEWFESSRKRGGMMTYLFNGKPFDLDAGVTGQDTLNGYIDAWKANVKEKSSIEDNACNVFAQTLAVTGQGLLAPAYELLGMHDPQSFRADDDGQSKAKPTRSWLNLWSKSPNTLRVVTTHERTVDGARVKASVEAEAWVDGEALKWTVLKASVTPQWLLAVKKRLAAAGKVLWSGDWVTVGRLNRVTRVLSWLVLAAVVGVVLYFSLPAIAGAGFLGLGAVAAKAVFATAWALLVPALPLWASVLGDDAPKDPQQKALYVAKQMLVALLTAPLLVVAFAVWAPAAAGMSALAAAMGTAGGGAAPFLATWGAATAFNVLWHGVSAAVVIGSNKIKFAQHKAAVRFLGKSMTLAPLLAACLWLVGVGSLTAVAIKATWSSLGHAAAVVAVKAAVLGLCAAGLGGWWYGGAAKRRASTSGETFHWHEPVGSDIVDDGRSPVKYATPARPSRDYIEDRQGTPDDAAGSLPLPGVGGEASG